MSKDEKELHNIPNERKCSTPTPQRSVPMNSITTQAKSGIQIELSVCGI
jgi:hypothetical protein